MKKCKKKCTNYEFILRIPNADYPKQDHTPALGQNCSIYIYIYIMKLVLVRVVRIWYF